MTRNLEAVQGWVCTRRRSVQVNAVQDGSLGSCAAPLRGTAQGCAGGTRCDTVRHLCRAPWGRLGLKVFGVAQFTPILVFSTKKQKTKSWQEVEMKLRQLLAGSCWASLNPEFLCACG